MRPSGSELMTCLSAYAGRGPAAVPASPLESAGDSRTSDTPPQPTPPRNPRGRPSRLEHQKPIPFRPRGCDMIGKWRLLAASLALGVVAVWMFAADKPADQKER